MSIEDKINSPYKYINEFCRPMVGQFISGNLLSWIANEVGSQNFANIVIVQEVDNESKYSFNVIDFDIDFCAYNGNILEMERIYRFITENGGQYVVMKDCNRTYLKYILPL